jgi:hypothetical protein
MRTIKKYLPLNQIIMNKKNGIICMFSLILTLNLFAQEQEHKNIIGIGAGISPSYEYDVWVGDPVFAWVTRNTGPVMQSFYARQVRDGLRLGAYFEYEYSTFKSSDDNASRYNIGLNWLSQYPNTVIHAQLGGYVGFGSIIASNLDQALNGADIGIMIGPAFEKDNFGIALHVQYGKGYYKTSGTSAEVGMALARLLLKVYYKL